MPIIFGNSFLTKHKISRKMRNALLFLTGLSALVILCIIFPIFPTEATTEDGPKVTDKVQENNCDLYILCFLCGFHLMVC